MPYPLPQQGRYWRLDDYCTTTTTTLQECLRAAGVKTRRDAGKPELIKEMHRLAKGGLDCKACATRDLSKFIKDRGIEWPKDSMKRDVLIATLEKADEEAMFERFLDLPPELREHVATFYIVELVSPIYKTDISGQGICMPSAEEDEDRKEVVLNRPVQPPLTRTCRLIRQETLPLFYKTCTFAMHFWYVYKVSQGLLRGECHLRPDEAAWLASTGAKNIKSLRSVHVRIDLHRWDVVYQLRVGEKVVCLGHNMGHGRKGDHLLGHLAQELEKVREQINAREGSSKFDVEDMGVLEKAIEIAVWGRFRSLPRWSTKRDAYPSLGSSCMEMIDDAAICVLAHRVR